MVEVVEINDIEELSKYRLLWKAMFAATPKASFFLTLEWLETAWRHFGEYQKLRVLIPYAAGRPLGILPLCVRREHYRLSTVRVLTYPLDDWGTWYGPIGPNPAATMLAAMQYLRRARRDWDMIELRWVADDSTCGGRSARALRAAGIFSEKRPYQSTSIIEFPKDWNDYLASKSPSIRRQFRHSIRNLLDSGRGEFIRYRPAPATEGDGDPGWQYYDMCETVARGSWQANVAHGNTLTHDRVREYFRDAHAAAARLGMADISLVNVDKQPAAFLYSYHTNGHVSALRTGFDPAISGLGTSLMAHSIEDSFQRGDRSIDLGAGEREHKRRVRTRTESTYRLTYTPIDSWRSQAVRFTRWAKNRWPSPQEVA